MVNQLQEVFIIFALDQQNKVPPNCNLFMSFMIQLPLSNGSSSNSISKYLKFQPSGGKITSYFALPSLKLTVRTWT